MLSADKAGSEVGASVYSKVLLRFSHSAFVMVPMTEPSVKKSDTFDGESLRAMTPLDLTRNPPRSPRKQLDGLLMLPRMIDIARAKLPGGTIGDYQIGRGMSGVVLKHFRLTVDEFVGIVAQAADDDEVSSRLPGGLGQADHSKLSSRLKGLTVADVPDDLRAEFQAFYGKNLPADRLVLDVLEEDDARSFPPE
jgi:hypothetical protein